MILKKVFLALSVSVLFAACSSLGKMEKNIEDVQYRVTPNPLEVHGGEVKLNIQGVFPEKYFDKKAVLTVTPVISFQGGETSFESVMLQGEKVEENNTAIAYKAGGTFRYASELPYTENMEFSNLMLDIKGTKGNKERVFERIQIGTGVIATPYLVENDEKALNAPHGFTRITKHQQKAQINYLVNSSVVRSSERRDSDMKLMGEFANQAKEDENVTVKNVVIEAFASPEGELRLNEKLADNRGASAKREIKRLFRRKVKDSDENFYNIIPKGEDWLGFKELMEASSIEDKDLILRILKMEKDLMKREEEIRNLAKTFVEIEDEILPKLRRSQVVANYEVLGKSDEEIKSLALSNPVDLNQEEILYAATLLQANEKEALLKQATEIYPDYNFAYNNYAVELMNNGKTDEALAALESSIKYGENEYAYNNMGVLKAQMGELDAAVEYYEKAITLGDDVLYNLAKVEVLKGEYAKASANVKDAKTLNAAIAKFLNANSEGALSILAEISQESAVANYLAAVIHAKEKNQEAMLSSLKVAIAKEASLKEKAAKDRSFYFYWNNDAFKALVK